MAENIKAQSAIKKVAAGYQNAIQIQNYEQQMAQYYADVAQEQINREYKDQIAEDQYRYQNEIIQMRNDAQLDAFEKSQQTYENNIKSIDFYAENQKDRIQLGLDEKIAEIGFAQSDLDNQFERKVLEAAYGTAEYDQMYNTAEDTRVKEVGKVNNQQNILASQQLQINDRISIKDKEDKQIQQQELSNSKEVDNLKTDQDTNKIEQTIQSRQTDQLAQDKQKAQNDKNYAFLQAEVEKIQSTGAARAKGQKGKSASKQVNALEAVVSLNMSKMVDDLFYSKAALERQRLSSADKAGIFDNLDTKLSRQIDIKGYERASLGFSRDIKGLEKSSLEKDKNQLTIQSSNLNLDKDLINIKAGDTKATAERNKDKIAEILGIDQKEFDLDQEKLAEQLLSEAEASEISLQELATKTFDAKSQAYEQQMLAPTLEPLMPAPYPTPQTTFIEPQAPIKYPKEAAGMGVGGNAGAQPVSAVSSVLGIASTVAGIAAPFTGGASLAVGAAATGLGFLSSIFK